MSNIIKVALLSLISSTVFAQEQAVSHLWLANQRGDTVSEPIPAEGFISVREGTQDFKAAIGLFPIVPNQDAADSLAQRDKPLVLMLEGEFPVQNIDFLTAADNAKQYTMTVTAYLNDSTLQVPLSFTLLVPEDARNDESVYPAQMSFIMLIDPKRFGLNVPPFDMNELILVKGANTLINKLE